MLHPSFPVSSKRRHSTAFTYLPRPQRGHPVALCVTAQHWHLIGCQCIGSARDQVVIQVIPARRRTVYEGAAGVLCSSSCWWVWV